MWWLWTKRPQCEPNHVLTVLYFNLLHSALLAWAAQLTSTTQNILNYTWKYLPKSYLNFTVQDQTFCIPLEFLTDVYKCTHYAVHKKGLASHTYVLPPLPARPSCIDTRKWGDRIDCFGMRHGHGDCRGVNWEFVLYNLFA